MKTFLKSALAAALCIGLGSFGYNAVAQSITGGGSSGTVNSGTAPGVAYYATNGTAVSDGTSAAVKAGTLALGGATIGSNALAVTGTAAISGTTQIGGATVSAGMTTPLLVAKALSAADAIDWQNSSAVNIGAIGADSSNNGQVNIKDNGANPRLTLGVSGGVSSVNFKTGGSLNAFITQAGAASLQLGAIDIDTAPVAQTLRSQGALTGGTNNVAGANWTFIASPGKGTGEGGSFIFQTAPAGGSGNTPNAPATVLTLAGNGTSTFTGPVIVTNSVAASGPLTINGNVTGSSGTPNSAVITPTIIQSGTAGYTALLVNPTESSTGSGSKLLQDWQVGGVTKASMDRTGALTLTSLSASSAVCTDGSKVLTTSGCTSAFPTVVAAKNNADQSLSSTTTTVKISFQTEDVDNSSAFASSTFTAPATGCYRATYTLFFTGSPTRVITEFEVNGSPQFQIEQRTLALSVFNAHDDRIICISSGQTIEVWGAMQGTTPSVQGTGVGISSFSVQRVS